ncbi:MAG: hypothetical protein CL840_18250 [Crocinitomicaceae bacterium]|nr:hypothetical protein [Crocinitomicaceae bacterium]|tara:strand:+ start:20683 stop:21471 length:789 start_codon:yes stop_codon:yes gene_type:complete
MKTIRDALILLAIFAGIWALFTWVPLFDDDSLSVEVSIEQEEKLGELIMDNFYSSSSYQRIKGNAADSAIRIISTRLKEQLDLSEFDYNIILVKDETINAFTLPGGNIVVLSGLVDFAENPEEVAAVIAHEMGHVEKRHVIDRLIKEFGIAILFSVVSGGDAILIQDLIQSLISQGFNRKQEAEADDFALQLLEKSSVSPRALATFFRRLNKKYGTFDDKMEIFLSHPAKNSRIKKSLQYELPEDFQTIEFDLDWDRVKESL